MAGPFAAQLMQIHTACTVHTDTSVASSSHYRPYCEFGIKPSSAGVNQLLSIWDVFKELAGVWPPVTQKWVSEVGPDHILSRIVPYVFRTISALCPVIVLLIGFWFLFVISGRYLFLPLAADPWFDFLVSGFWPWMFSSFPSSGQEP